MIKNFAFKLQDTVDTLVLEYRKHLMIERSRSPVEATTPSADLNINHKKI